MGSTRLPPISKFVVDSICMTNNIHIVVVVGAVTLQFLTIPKGKGITHAHISSDVLMCMSAKNQNGGGS